MATIFGMKLKTRIGFWNVRTLFEKGKLRQVEREMDSYKLDILGLSEVRWLDHGEMTTREGGTFLYSGPTGEGAEHRAGVGILLTRTSRRSLIEWKPVSDRLLTARFKSKIRNISIIQCYAPTEPSEEDVKEEYYRTLKEALNDIPRRDIVIVMGDLNAKVGSDNEGLEHIMGRHGIGQANDNGEKFRGFCAEHDLVIGGTIFPHKECHKVSWVSPDQTTENQIDHFAMSRKFRRSIMDVRNKRGADVGSDHHLMIATLRLKITSAAMKFEKKKKRLDVKKLKIPEVREELTAELQNKLQPLQLAGSSIDEHWGALKTNILEVGETCLGYENPQKKEWMTDDTWNEIERRKQLKQMINQSKTRQQKAQAQQKYSTSNRLVKRKTRNDHRQWVNDLARKAEEAARIGDAKELYSITRTLSKKGFRKTRPIKSKSGTPLTTQAEQLRRWEEHFSEVLNRECTDAEEPLFRLPDTGTAVIDVSPPTITEITSALTEMKNGKSPGIDGIPAEILKVDARALASIIEPLFRKIWEEERVPAEWKNGIIVKIPKKGDISECTNWRGVTLLPVLSKVLNRVILKRIKASVEHRLRKEQAGFREHRSCTDLINTLRIILEQSIEWQSPLYLAFIDFEKAFDSINQEIMWKILERYGLPSKIINLIRSQYDGYVCRIVHEGVLSNPIGIETGVKQGCVLSPTLFIIVLDSIMRASLGGRRRGIQWGLRERLEDLDFADDLCLLAQRFSDLQDKLGALCRIASRVGLRINIGKTKEMRKNERCQEPLVLWDDTVEQVESFVYLGSVVTMEGGTAEDVKSRIKKANGVFVQLYPVWKNRNLSRNTKLRLFNSNVKSVLLYGSETWKVTESITRPLQTFVNRCLRRIMGIWWPETISNEDLWAATNQLPIRLEIRRRKWKWIGHTLRKPDGAIEKAALRWNPQGERKRGRPRETWRRSVDKELGRAGKTWQDARRIAAGRNDWKTLVEALCSSRS